MQFPLGEFVFELEAAGNPGDPLVLLLHGFPQTSHTWRHQMAPLAQAGYFAVAPDQRGYSPGARPTDIAEYATDKLVDDALALIDVLGNGRAHVVGHDWGGQLCWLLAAHYAERIETLSVLSRPHPQAFVRALENDVEQANRSKHHKAFQDPNSAKLLLENDARRLRELFSAQGVAGEDQDAYLQILGSGDALDAAINWYRAPVQASEPRLTSADTPAVNVPTLYIWGDADATVGAMAAQGTSAYVDARYRFEVLPDVGHFVTDQAGTRVTELLLEHLRT